MKKRKKYGKVLLAFVLVVALFTVQGLQIAANAKADLSNPTILVSNYEQLMEALQNAQDGDVIGITTVIEINEGNVAIGSDDKHIYFVRAGEFGYLKVKGSLTMQNVTLDGNTPAYHGEGAMIWVERGHLVLNNVTMQKCDGGTNGAAIFVNIGGRAEINNCIFDNNSASQGSHIHADDGNIQITNSIFNNGFVYYEGGAIYIASRSTVSISSSIICDNKAGNYGGGIYNNGSLTIDSTLIYDNTASNGSDIANTKTSQFQIDSLDDVKALYEARNIVPKEWVLNSNNPNDNFDTTSNISLMKLVYEIKGEEPPSTEELPSSEQSPNGDDKKDDTSSGGENSGSDTGSSATNSSTDNSTTDNSKTTDSHNSTTNNYYTYNNPANNTNTGKDSSNGKSSSATNNVTVASTTDTKTQNSSQGKEDAVAEIKEDDNTVPNVQMPDNIKLNLQYVDVVYEMIDERSNIEISTSTQQQANTNMTSASQPTMEPAVVQERSVMQTASAFKDNMSQQESSSIDWYEVIKILLLAALFIVLVPKPKQRVISQNEIITPKPKKKLKPQDEVDTPRPKRKKEKREKERE